MTTWRARYYPGVWKLDQFTRPVTGQPAYQIPFLLLRRFNNSRSTIMPGGPYVQSYHTTLTTGKDSEFGYPTMEAKVTVKWKEEVLKAISDRQTLFGMQGQKDLDTYHSQCAFSSWWLMLNQLSKKIQRAREQYKVAEEIRQTTSEKWDDVLDKVIEYISSNMSFDPISAMAYARDHEHSAAIPGTEIERSIRWTELSRDDLKYLYTLGKAFLEDYQSDEKLKNRIHNPEAIGRGIRARSPEISQVSDEYNLVFDQTRGVGFVPYLSTGFAFVPEEKKPGMYRIIKDEAESILGKEILLPALEKGKYWSMLNDYVKDGYRLVTLDGKSWEIWCCVLSKAYIFGVDDGVQQMISGGIQTSVMGVIEMLRLQEYINDPEVRALGSMGDNQTIVTTRQASDCKQIPNIYELDEAGTRNGVILGLKSWIGSKGEYYGTFPGLYRITVDRAAKRIPLAIDTESSEIRSTIGTDSFKIYDEIMRHGTINNEPFVDYIGKIPEVDWELWHEDKFELITQMAKGKGYEKEIIES